MISTNGLKRHVSTRATANDSWLVEVLVLEEPALVLVLAPVLAAMDIVLNNETKRESDTASCLGP